LPGIAGIVLTVGMAVDANVLIFERIREELRNGVSPQASIHAGYQKAFSTIADANVTTLIAALVLYAFGTGPIKGFAVTLSIGIITSMFTAIVVTRAIVNLLYGGKRVERLAI
jgi:preprotein translocase subunit SecD